MEEQISSTRTTRDSDRRLPPQLQHSRANRPLHSRFRSSREAGLTPSGRIDPMAGEDNCQLVSVHRSPASSQFIAFHPNRLNRKEPLHPLDLLEQITLDTVHWHC